MNVAIFNFAALSEQQRCQFGTEICVHIQSTSLSPSSTADCSGAGGSFFTVPVVSLDWLDSTIGRNDQQIGGHRWWCLLLLRAWLYGSTPHPRQAATRWVMLSPTNLRGKHNCCTTATSLSWRAAAGQHFDSEDIDEPIRRVFQAR